MNWRCAISLALVTTPALFVGCGYSEEEWQAKLNQNKALTDELNSEKAAHQKAEADLKAAGDQLKRLGVDISNLNASVADKDAALEKLRRDKAQLDEIRKRFDALKQKLESLTKLGLNVTVRNNRMTIQLPGDVLFDSGRTDLKKDGKEILLKVADVVRNDPQLLSRSFQVAGHTDNKPLAGGPFKDNWGLSLMRAREVLSFLITPVGDKAGGGGMPAKSWSAAGYGETDPILGNDAPENMQKNRRVELVVLPNVEEMLDLKSLTK
jgi:chemotaxis protein MotB